MSCYCVLLLPELKTQRTLDAPAAAAASTSLNTIAIKGSLRS